MLIIGDVSNHRASALNPVAGGTLGMIQRERADGQAARLDRIAGFDLMEIAIRRHLTEIDGEVRLRHLPFQRFLERPSRRTRKERDVVVGAVKRCKERQALNMIPVKVRQEDPGFDGLSVRLLHQALARSPHPAAGVEDDGFVLRGANFHARRVSSKLEVFNLRCRGGTADAPYLEPGWG